MGWREKRADNKEINKREQSQVPPRFLTPSVPLTRIVNTGVCFACQEKDNQTKKSR